MTGTQAPLSVRIWRFIPESRPDECWRWSGATRKYGYGAIWDGRRSVSAHRAMWELWIGPIPIGFGVLHRCDNPPCVNPAHLFLGTQADNVEDMFDKGRGLRGEDAGSSRFTEGDVLEIRRQRKSGVTLEVLAVRYGTSSGHISRISSGQCWGHVHQSEVIVNDRIAGRRPFDADTVAKIFTMRSEGRSYYAIAKALGLPSGSVWKRLNAKRED